MERILILGTTKYAEVFIDMFECVENKTIVGCVENRDRSRCSESLAGLPIFWSDDIADYAGSHKLICVLGTSLRKPWIEECLKLGFEFTSLVHPSTVISGKTRIGAGVSVDAGTVIAGFSEIAEHARVGRRACLGHHTTIGKFTTIHPGAIISGNCSISSQVIVGAGAIVIDGISIGTGAVIAAGSVVTKDVPDNVLIAGNPGVVKRQDYGPR